LDKDIAVETRKIDIKRSEENFNKKIKNIYIENKSIIDKVKLANVYRENQ
jgi:hypothetical protein